MMRTQFMDGKSARFGSIDIADYAEAVSEYRAFIEGANGKQPKDPKQLAEHIASLASRDRLSSRLVFGDDARQWAAARIDQLHREIDQGNNQG